jgi:hypothetical protein
MAHSSTTFAPGNRFGRGRPKGSLNKVTAEAREMARALLQDPEYRENLVTRLRTGTVAPAVEVMLWNYAYGKPKDELAIQLEILIGREMARIAELTEGARSLAPEVALLEAPEEEGVEP